MILRLTRKHEDRLALAHIEAARWKHRAETAERTTVNLRKIAGQYRVERDEAIANLRDVVAERVNHGR